MFLLKLGLLSLALQIGTLPSDLDSHPRIKGPQNDLEFADLCALHLARQYRNVPWRSLAGFTNGFRDAYLAMRRQMRSQRPSVRPSRVDLKTWKIDTSGKTDAVLLNGDFRGDSDLVEETRWLLEEGDFDWIAIPHLPRKFQAELDALLKNPRKDFSHPLKSFLQAHYVETYIPRKSDEFFVESLEDLLRTAARNQIRIILLEDDKTLRLGEDARSIALSNYFWAQRIPKAGRGLVFGGILHFTASQGFDFQDFLSRDLQNVTYLYDRDRLSFNAERLLKDILRLVTGD